MKVLVGLLLILLVRSKAFSSHAFCSQPKNRISNESKGKTTQHDILRSVAEKSDQYDNYYDDLDPSQFDLGPNDHDYKLVTDAGPNQSTLSEPEIHHMLATRHQHWLRKDYATSKTIGKDLRNAGVQVNDRTREWRADGVALTITARTYVQSKFSIPNEKTDAIQALVDERAKALVKRLYKKVGELSAVLFHQFQVNVNDKSLEWSVGGGCFGPYGHDYRLAAGAGPNQSSLTEPEIHGMVATRLQHFLIQDYATAKEIGKELRNAGVEVHDEKREWRADGVVFNGLFVQRFVQSELSTPTEDTDEIQALVDERAKAKAQRLFEKVEEISVNLFRQFRVNVNDKSLEWSVGGGCFGPNGHDYKLTADAGPNQSTLSETEIHKMLASRFQHFLIQDSRMAKKIREDLRKAGVEVNDTTREWRADGAFFNGFVVQTYAQSELSKSTANADEIQALVDERAKAKAQRRFEKVEEISAGLFRQFQVNVSDKRLEWSVGGGCFGPHGHDYELATDAGPNQSTLSEPEIHQMIASRFQHFLIQDSKMAKKIREDLRNAGVEVDDTTREWRADGAFFNGFVVQTYAQSILSRPTEDSDEIQALVDERAKAKAQRLFEKVEELSTILFRQFHVSVNDKCLEWSVGGGCFGPNGHDYKLVADAGPNQSTLSEPMIHQMLATRLQHFLTQDYATAKKIGKELRNAGVQYADETREWRADGVDFAITARTYVQSKFSTSTADADEIQELVDERAQANADGLLKKANEIRRVLFRKFQVNVNDRSLEWSVGGGCFGPNGHDYKLAADAGANQSSLTDPEIHEILATRLQHMLIKDFRTASRLRDELRKLGVETNDTTREWRADGAFFTIEVFARTYVQSEFSASTEDADEIQVLVDERAKAMSEGRWAPTDEMREVLFRRFQVTLSDERFEWSVGGGCFGPNGHDYELAADAGPNKSTLSEPEIHQMLSKRLQHWSIMDYMTADSVRKELRKAGVEVNDKTREWRADGVPYNFVSRTTKCVQ